MTVAWHYAAAIEMRPQFYYSYGWVLTQQEQIER
jgi:hypothetical protein